MTNSVIISATELPLSGQFDRFRDVFITDATDSTLSAASFEDFRAIATIMLERNST